MFQGSFALYSKVFGVFPVNERESENGTVREEEGGAGGGG